MFQRLRSFFSGTEKFCKPNFWENENDTGLSKLFFWGSYVPSFLNLILHTARFNNYALNLKSNTAKYYFGEIQCFAYRPKILLWIKKNVSQAQKHFNCNAWSVLKRNS